MPDTTLLSWISTEVDQALNLVRDKIAKYSAGPEDEAVLRVCPEHLHQVSGALRMVGLAGATRFCEAIEGSFTGLNGAQPAGADSRKSAMGVIDRAVVALKDFVDDLANGKANVPLGLFAAYRDITALQGKADSSEKDLFFPEQMAPPPADSKPKQLTGGELVPYLQAQRSRFQRGVLGWLRNQPGGLEEMGQAVDAVHQIASQLPEPRGLWWAGGGLLEGLQADKASPVNAEWAASAKALANKVDFYMRDLAAGAHKGNDALLREVLYTVAKSKLSTPRIKEIRQLYNLDSLFPVPLKTGAMEYDMDWLQPALGDVRSRLEALKGVWLQYISGEPKSVVRFRELVASFKSKAAELGNAQLAKLLDAIALVCARLPDPHPQQNQFMVIEMASAFLLVESVIENFTSPADDLEEQIVIMGGWLLDAAKGKSPGQLPAGLRADLSRQIGAMQLRAQVAKEILANLQHVEQVLDAFARDASKRETLNGLEPYLRQIHGALVVLGFEKAAEVLSICETMTAALAAADHPQAAQDMDWIAEGLSSLGFFLDPCLRGVEPAQQAIALFFRRYEQRGGAAPEPAGQPAVVPDLVLDSEPAAPAKQADVTVVLAKPEGARQESLEATRPPVNEELLAIYLDEAGEVLATINAALPDCREQPQNRDALTTIRRGFHTLKGSGRMVGLMDLGEVAWEVEQVMNRWLEQQRPVGPSLLELIALASAGFATWVDQLRAGSLKGEIDAARIVELARRLKSGEITEPPPSAAEPDEVVIGDVRLGRNTFRIYVNEAQGHVATLRDQCRRWAEAPASEPPHEFLRAAHTLASSSRTAGFAEIAELAAAVEQWIPFARQVTESSDTSQAQAAAERLRRMVPAGGRAPPP